MNLNSTFAVDLSLPLAKCRRVHPLVAVVAGEAALVPGLASPAHQLGEVNAFFTPDERGHEFEYRYRTLDEHISNSICCKQCFICLKIPKINEKEAVACHLKISLTIE